MLDRLAPLQIMSVRVWLPLSLVRMVVSDKAKHTCSAVGRCCTTLLIHHVHTTHAHLGRSLFYRFGLLPSFAIYGLNIGVALASCCRQRYNRLQRVRHTAMFCVSGVIPALSPASKDQFSPLFSCFCSSFRRSGSPLCCFCKQDSRWLNSCAQRLVLCL